MGALLSLLGGGTFRAILSQVTGWLDKRQAHKQELDLMRLQEQINAAQHARNQEAIRTQAELGIKTINVQADADVSRREVDAWVAEVQNRKPTGILWVDAWNGCIRPAFGTLALILVLFMCYKTGWIMTGWTMDLVGVVIGYFFIDRTLTKKGK
jgi:HAMP domain-containing protein